MTTTPQPTDLTPVQCEPWCTDGDGHPNTLGRRDQTCCGPEHYIEARVEEVLTEYNKYTDTTTTFPPRVGVMAYRGAAYLQPAV
jgi:hypothetical protein